MACQSTTSVSLPLCLLSTWYVMTVTPTIHGALSPKACSNCVRSTTWSVKVMCDDSDSNKPWSIVTQGMFQLHEINQMECEMCYCTPLTTLPPTTTTTTFPLLAHRSYTNIHLHHCTTSHIPTSHKYINSISAHWSFNDVSSMDMLTPWSTGPTIMAGVHHFLHSSWWPIGILLILSCPAIQFITQILFTIL